MDNPKKKFYLIIKKNYFAFHVISENYEILFNEKIFYIYENLNKKLEVFKKFLDENIFKIEKKFNLYIEDVFLIIDDESFINIDISLIKNFKHLYTKINDNLIDLSNIRESILKSNIDFQLAHMIINKFIIDKKYFSVLPDKADQKNLFLEIRFICLKTKTFVNFKEILSAYQISIKKVLNYEYVNSFKIDGVNHISLVADKLINGHNKNEINLRDKHPKNIGFFEKFFNFFS